MESSIQASQTTVMPKPKPALGPKPRLAPKPFALQTNTTIRSISAPKMVAATSKTATRGSSSKLPTTAPKPPSSESSSVRTKETKASQLGEDTLDSHVGKPDPAPAPAKEKPVSTPLQKDNILQTNNKTPTDNVTQSEQKEEKKKDETPTSVSQKLEDSGSDISSTASPAYRWGSTRKRLSMELTSKFESGGIPLPILPAVTKHTTSTKHDVNKPESTNPEQNQTRPEPSNIAVDDNGLKEDYIGGGSIKRRISLLFDSKPEVTTKKEEPEMINSTGGVKARIKNWVTEKSSEKKPELVPRPRLKSNEPATPPAAEKMQKMPPAEPPTEKASSNEVVDRPSTFSLIKEPTETLAESSKDVLTEDESSERQTETSGEHMKNKLSEGDVQVNTDGPSVDHTNERDSAVSGTAGALNRDNVKRRSVHFGVVERDDGSPSLILGSESDSTEGEEEDETKEDIPVSVPVYRRVGHLEQEDSVNKQEAERLKHLEFERKCREEKREEARIKLEEEHKQKEEEEREKEKARKMEAEEKERERLRDEEMKRQSKERERVRMEEEEREKERLREEEMERQRKEQERVRLEEEVREKERLREEELERQRKERERIRMEEEEREKERLREEEMERQRKERERIRVEEEEREKERLREEMERQRKEQERIRMEEEEREKERLREEMERQRKEWERVRMEEEEMENEKLKKEEMERERQIAIMWNRQREEGIEKKKEQELKQEELEKEKLKDEIERQWLRSDEEEKVIHESEEHRMEAKLRQEEVNKEKQEEREWENEWVSKAERFRGGEEEVVEREGKKELEFIWHRQKAGEERKSLTGEVDERERQRRLEEEQEDMEKMEQTELEKQREEAIKGGMNLISSDSENILQKSKSPYSHLKQTYEPTVGEIEVVYEDFSIKKSLFEVEFDDFSVKPKKWGSQTREETGPVIQSGAANSMGEEEVDDSIYKWKYKPAATFTEVPKQVDNTNTMESTLVLERKEEEEQLISISGEEEENEKEEDTKEVEDVKEEALGNSHCINDEDKDSDVLINSGPEEQTEVCEETSEIDSLNPDSYHHLEFSSEDVDTTDFNSKRDLDPFPETTTPLLDSSAQKSKADLCKRRLRRTRPSRSRGAELSQSESPDWRTRDSLGDREVSSKQRESDSEDEQPKQKIFSPHSTSQRVPIFPGLSPAALIAQIKRKTGRGGEETEEDERRQEKESEHQEAAPSPPVLSSSPRAAAHLAGAARVLPPLGGTDGGSGSCPAWLKELKSKKRLSQHDGEP